VNINTDRKSIISTNLNILVVMGAKSLNFAIASTLIS
jgi:hypothetical protein